MSGESWFAMFRDKRNESPPRPPAASRQSGNTTDICARKLAHELPRAGWQPAVPSKNTEMKDVRAGPAHVSPLGGAGLLRFATRSQIEFRRMDESQFFPIFSPIRVCLEKVLRWGIALLCCPKNEGRVSVAGKLSAVFQQRTPALLPGFQGSSTRDGNDIR